MKIYRNLCQRNCCVCLPDFTNRNFSQSDDLPVASHVYSPILLKRKIFLGDDVSDLGSTKKLLIFKDDSLMVEKFMSGRTTGLLSSEIGNCEVLSFAEQFIFEGLVINQT